MTCGREKNCSGARPCVLFQPRVELPIRALCGKVTAVGLGARPCVLFQHRVELPIRALCGKVTAVGLARVSYSNIVYKKRIFTYPTYNKVPEINIT
jgi:hypothetical protein